MVVTTHGVKYTLQLHTYTSKLKLTAVIEKTGKRLINVTAQFSDIVMSEDAVPLFLFWPRVTMIQLQNFTEANFPVLNPSKM